MSQDKIHSDQVSKFNVQLSIYKGKSPKIFLCWIELQSKLNEQFVFLQEAEVGGRPETSIYVGRLHPGQQKTDCGRQLRFG